MFSKTELIDKAGSPETIPQISLQVKKYSQDDFKEPEAEQSIVFCYAEKNEVENITDFYLNALSKSGISKDYIIPFLEQTSLQLKSIDKEKFESLILEQTENLREEFTLSMKGDFVSGIILVENWDYISVIAETSQEYIAFFWETIA
ncbi:MAG TPA: hypothetical protein VNW99_00845 [Cytophagaceae bacterium]|jgi:hypothetical protein|nr:hypothetical protein [Cytophagaceae bacterium]